MEMQILEMVVILLVILSLAILVEVARPIMQILALFIRRPL